MNFFSLATTLTRFAGDMAKYLSSEAFEIARVKPLLDFVAVYESRGLYDIEWGGRVTPAMTQMTINQIYAHMDDMLARQRQRFGSGKSTAVGRYQIIRATMQMLVAQMKIDPATTLYSPANQDRMALRLLKNRGLDRYLRGDMTEQQFAVELAKEWASMPMSTGRSYYDRDGLNKALVPYADFIAVVRAIRDGTSP